MDRKSLRSPGRTGTEQRSKPTSLCIHAGHAKAWQGTETPAQRRKAGALQVPPGLRTPPFSAPLWELWLHLGSVPCPQRAISIPCCTRSGFQATDKCTVSPWESQLPHGQAQHSAPSSFHLSFGKSKLEYTQHGFCLLRGHTPLNSEECQSSWPSYGVSEF